MYGWLRLYIPLIIIASVLLYSRDHNLSACLMTLSTVCLDYSSADEEKFQ